MMFSVNWFIDSTTMRFISSLALVNHLNDSAFVSGLHSFFGLCVTQFEFLEVDLVHTLSQLRNLFRRFREYVSYLLPGWGLPQVFQVSPTSFINHKLNVDQGFVVEV